MKLKKLTIDNIASIEHAEIDFDAAPLAGEHLFLITGETGAGKSTIIDCICLALYGKTPRLGHKEKNTEYDDGTRDKLKTNDVRQLLRRGAVSADVRLTFDDNDGIPYIATWHIHRAHRKLANSIKTAERTLSTDEGINPPVYKEKTKEIDDEIVKLVGLDMNQFQRTVVLAQGKFAEFLNSNEKEKSELLEKMTGTEVYSRIGSKIYEVCRDKENKRNLLSEKMNNITVLGDDDKRQIDEEITTLGQQQAEALKLAEGAKKMAQWIDDKARNEQELAAKQQELATKQELTRQPDHIEQQRLVTEWDATSEPRRELKVGQQAQRQLTMLQAKKPALQQEFDELCAALRGAHRQLETQRQQLEQVNGYLHDEAPNSDMYRNVTSIKALLNQRKDELVNVATFTRALQQDQERKPQVEGNVKRTLEAMQQQEQQVKDLEAQYARMNVGNINSRKDALNAAKQSLILFLTSHTALEDATHSLDELKGTLATERQLLASKQATVDDKRALKEQASDAVERERDWNALIEQAHKSLHEGDHCPICGSVIEQLRDPSGKNVLDELKARLKQAEDDLNHTLTDIAADEKSIKRLDKQLAADEKELRKKTAEHDSQWQRSRQLLEAVGMTAGEQASPEQATTLSAAIDKEVETLNEQLQQANALNSRITSERTTLTKLAEAHNNAKIDLNQVNDSIKHQQEAITTSTSRSQSLTTELDNLLTIKDWQQRDASEGEGFVNALQHRATEYKDKEALSRQLSQAISVAAALIPAMEDCKRNIKGLVDNGMTADTMPAKLDELWHQFENKSLSWNNELDNEQEKANQAQQALDQYLAENPAMTQERIVALSNHRQDEIDAIKESHRSLKEAITHMQGEIAALTKRQADIAGQKPEFHEEDRERLDEISQTSLSRHEELTNRIAELKSRLSTDAANRKLLGETKQAYDQAEAEYQQWADFGDLLGDATGAKFRNIAQSYILGELLASANGYLSQFNNRYELEAKTGTLTILVRDLQQGDLTSVNTLSGGEGFMVSLALALALSSTTGKIFSVDTLFIDEGFGSLSENYLDNVMDTLNRLYEMGGRRVGIISHVEMLKERVTTQIQVKRDPANNTVSRVSVVGE